MQTPVSCGVRRPQLDGRCRASAFSNYYRQATQADRRKALFQEDLTPGFQVLVLVLVAVAVDDPAVSQHYPRADHVVQAGGDRRRRRAFAQKHALCSHGYRADLDDRRAPTDTHGAAALSTDSAIGALLLGYAIGLCRLQEPGSPGYRRARIAQAPILCEGFDESPPARPSAGQESEPVAHLSRQATAISRLCRAVRPERTPPASCRRAAAAGRCYAASAREFLAQVGATADVGPLREWAGI